MASQTKILRCKRNWKDKPNKANLKENMKRIQRNREILAQLASQKED